MEDPVVAGDRRSYERDAITRWLQTGRLLSPLTGLPLPNREITENISMRLLIQSLLPRIHRNQRVALDFESAIQAREQFIHELLLKKDAHFSFLKLQLSDHQTQVQNQQQICSDLNSQLQKLQQQLSDQSTLIQKK